MVERLLPLYEAKMIHQYDHRWATYDGALDSKGQPAARDVTSHEKRDANFVALPRYWVPAGEVAKRLGDRSPAGWYFGYRWITNTTNERTFVAGSVPLAGAGNSLPIAAPVEAPLVSCASASFVLDFVARQKLGGSNMTFGTTQQLTFPHPRQFDDHVEWVAPLSLADWLHPRILELTYTAWDMAPFAEDLDDIDPITGRINPPFIWDDDRRALLRAEIDAAFFHLYGITRDDVDYILDTFPIVRKHDKADHGEYRTKRLILQSYDAMAAASSGHRYTSPVTPPPGHGPRHAR